ncbi:proline-rich transmembrane protein 1-like [Pseudonaja textilis]|uniref:proline-rich transmembrane protein 1-like n=1 Tax=Pseudonaja textilis TaxID=8673 RepID=UPI000EA9A5D0|nr:proline-rich transmembrane protein 1-like [Pseudonaja textilis]
MMTNPSYEAHIPVPANPSPYPEEKPHEESDSLKFHVEPTSSLGYGAASSMPAPPQYQMYQDPPSAKPRQDLFVESQEDIFISHIQTSNEPDYLRYSICTMFCCFLPFGIVAVIYSIKTQESNRSGNSTAARENSRLARIFIYCAVGIGIIFWILYITLAIRHSNY